MSSESVVKLNEVEFVIVGHNIKAVALVVCQNWFTVLTCESGIKGRNVNLLEMLAKYFRCRDCFMLLCTHVHDL